MRRPVRVGAGLALARSALASVNHLTLPRLEPSASAPEPVTVCIPARNERDRLPQLIGDLRAQRGVSDLRVLVLDDDSSDDTYAVAVAAIAGDPRFAVHRSTADPPQGWLGKQAACARLAELADTGILAFLDADIRLSPDAVAAAAAALRSHSAALLTPWPLQDAGSIAEQVVQPLLCWSWAATLPMRLANASSRPSTAVACGQFLVFDAAAYRGIGGHAAVAGSLTEDLDLARTLRRAGHRTVALPAGSLASCRMYRGRKELDAGYTRWLWQAYGGTPGSIAVAVGLVLTDLLPVAAAVAGRGHTRTWGLLGYLGAVGSRLVARSMERGSLTEADVAGALAHPLSISAYLTLVVRSHVAHRRRRLGWKGREITTALAR